MTDAEQIEDWRKEFESLDINCTRCFERHHMCPEKYWLDRLQKHWEGFLICKQSQPVIELPSVPIIPNEYNDGFNRAIWLAEEAITAAGYKYKVKD